MRHPIGVLAAVLTMIALEGATAAPAQSAVPRARTRIWFIAADEVTWDYMPSGRDEIAGRPYADTAFFASAKPRPVSTKYRKVLYREYTDSSFKTLKPRAPEWEHLGFLGPVVHAVVGDTIRIVFRNNGHRVFSMHPHGVFYEKSSEGVPYNDNSSGKDKMDDSVPPGATYTYVWSVPARAGPGPMDGSSVMWMYHSHVNEVRDIDAGLMGAIIVTSRKMAREDGTPKDVDREIIANFAQVEENDSWLAGQNMPHRFIEDARANSESLGGAGDLPVVQQVLDQRLRARKHAPGGANAEARTARAMVCDELDERL